jgi:hypothetical protein
MEYRIMIRLAWKCWTLKGAKLRISDDPKAWPQPKASHCGFEAQKTSYTLNGMKATEVDQRFRKRSRRAYVILNDSKTWSLLVSSSPSMMGLIDAQCCIAS